MKRADYSAFSKSNVEGEKIFRQKNFDEQRMDQMTDCLIAMRKKEKKKSFMTDEGFTTAQKPSKHGEKESLVS